MELKDHQHVSSARRGQKRCADGGDSAVILPTAQGKHYSFTSPFLMPHVNHLQKPMHLIFDLGPAFYFLHGLGLLVHAILLTFIVNMGLIENKNSAG
jgi:hypothetical protein